MKQSKCADLFYGLFTLTSLLIAILGYVYTHKPFSPENLIGIVTALWQTFIAFSVIALAGGIGDYFLKLHNRPALVRIGLDVALGIPILSIVTLTVGSILGVGFLPIGTILCLLIVLFYKSIAAWLRLFPNTKSIPNGKFATVIALMVVLIFGMHFSISLAPPTKFDSLVYHFSLPKAYLQEGKIQYIPDNVFWGMPQITEMLYLLSMRFAGVESASMISFLIGSIAMLGISGYINDRFGKIAAWTAVAAMLAGESLTISLSSGYVEWSVILFGWATIVTVDYWFETQDRKMLILGGIFCGAAIGTKYTAGVILLGNFSALLFLASEHSVKKRISSVFTVGTMTVLFSLPWWIKNYVATGNPFYPFLFPAGAMNEYRLFHYQNVPIWSDWKSVILLPWQATIWGAESKEGFSASIGAIFVALSPLAWIGWKSRTVIQKLSLKIAFAFVLVGFTVWAIGSRFSGLLIQARLFFGIFSAWALLAAAGMDSIWKLHASNIRFGRVAGALVILMLGFNLFATWTQFISSNPLAYVVRQEDEQRYLLRNMGTYVNAMDALNDIPSSSYVLMLWEARVLYCWPRCDADEVIDRWYEDINTYKEPQLVLQSWKAKGYTHLFLFQAGADFVRDNDPRYTVEQWEKLETLLSYLPPPNMVGPYALYSLKN